MRDRSRNGNGGGEKNICLEFVANLWDIELMNDRAPISRHRKLRDFEIRDALTLRLQQSFPKKTGSLIIEEFGCRASRIDVAVINCKLHGYEIKSDCDTLSRLLTQAPSYSAIFNRMTLVATAKHIEQVPRCIPDWWGIVEAVTMGEVIILRDVRDAKDNNAQDADELSRMLWRKEAYSVLRARGLEKGLRSAPAAKLSRIVAEKIPVKEIADELRAAIKARGGSGFDRQQTRNGGSCTTKPTESHYQSNLDWLLSLKCRDPLR